MVGRTLEPAAACEGHASSPFCVSATWSIARTGSRAVGEQAGRRDRVAGVVSSKWLMTGSAGRLDRKMAGSGGVGIRAGSIHWQPHRHASWEQWRRVLVRLGPPLVCLGRLLRRGVQLDQPLRRIGYREPPDVRDLLQTLFHAVVPGQKQRLGVGVRPLSVVPASSTLAMFGWSIIDRACRSASNRATTCLESIPGLMILRATLRRTGSSCSAMYTTPMPPSPITWSSLYGP